VLLALALLVSAPAAESKSEGPLTLTGRIERVGTVYTPALNLVTDDGHRYDVLGDLSSELARLEGGARLEVKALKEKSGSLLPRVRVASYKIVELPGGAKPEVGIVELEGESVVLRVEPTGKLTLSDTPVAQRLKGHAGEKVWVVGKTSSQGLFKVWRVGFLGTPASAKSPQAASQAASQPTP
jgi:hypothetical protein